MDLKEAKEIIQTGLVWAKWTDDQKDAMRLAIKCINTQIELEKK